MLGLGNRSLQIPSVVFVDADGRIYIGESAERRGQTDPGRMVREFKRRFGDHVPILVGGASYSAESLSARLLSGVVATATERMGGPPEAVVITYPANWGPYKLDLLDQVAAMAGLPEALRCTEPEAAAAQYAAHADLAVGDRLAIYDLGGGTFDACVLEKTDEGFALLGTPGGLEHLGGVDFDQAVFGHVLGSIKDTIAKLDPDDQVVTSGLARLRRECIEAKEALSSDTDVVVPVALPGISTSVRLTRSELEAMIRPGLVETVAAMRRALQSASLQPSDLTATVLAGGSSRIPLVSEILQSELGVTTAVDLHPKHDIALGAARAAHLLGRGATVKASPSPPSPVVVVRRDTSVPERAAGQAVPEPSPTAPATTANETPEVAATATFIERTGAGAISDVEAEEDHPRARLALNPRWVVLAAVATVVLAVALILGLRNPDGQAGPAASSAASTAASTASPTETASPSAGRGALNGSYTWASGVRLRMSVKAERWGSGIPTARTGPAASPTPTTSASS